MSSPCSKEYWEKVTLEWLALSAEMRARYNDLATSASDAAFSETVAALALLDDAFCNSRGEQQEPRPPSYLSPWIEWCVWVCVCGGGAAQHLSMSVSSSSPAFGHLLRWGIAPIPPSITNCKEDGRPYN